MEWEDGKIRCRWANPKNERYLNYHDKEWGIPVHDDRKLFEMLVLECFQAGLSWECVLNKQEAFCQAFDGFDLEKVCAYDEEKLNDLITNDETFTRVDVETVAAINLFVGTDIKYDEKEEVVNMCKAWDDHKKLGIQEGIQQGLQQGRCLEVYSLVQDGILEPEVGAKRVSMSLDDFVDAMQKAGYKIPELV